MDPRRQFERSGAKRDGAMSLLLRSYGRDAEVVAASFFFTAVIFGFLPIVGFPAFGRETLRKLRVAKREEALQPPREDR
jgi:hypothetical protein